MSHKSTPGECEALVILKQLADLPVTANLRLEQAGRIYEIRNQAHALVRALQLRTAQVGHPCRTPAATLRRISQLHVRGMTHQQIADSQGLSRDSVRHHLKPSPAMLAALLD